MSSKVWEVQVANRNQPNHVWINDGSDVFENSGQTLGSDNTTSITLADLDNDGDIDLVEGIDGDVDKVWFNDGSGDFSNSGQTLGDAATNSIALADLDGDGDIDAVTGNTNQSDYVWKNDGTGAF